ncbi:MAG: T9SS type A sorting domain-containing protein [Bacteroidetes bacterium]|nr:T9SS type A sorting domain-containing protein [Bacteroidota bacterium]
MDGSVQTIKIFPNPVSEVITIKSSSSLKNAIIQILDSNGRSVYEGNFSGTLETVNVSKLVEGLYLFKILDKSKPIFSEKISVLRR